MFVSLIVVLFLVFGSVNGFINGLDYFINGNIECIMFEFVIFIGILYIFD